MQKEKKLKKIEQNNPACGVIRKGVTCTVGMPEEKKEIKEQKKYCK